MTKYRVKKKPNAAYLPWRVYNAKGDLVWTSATLVGAHTMALMFAKRHDLHEDLEAHPW